MMKEELISIIIPVYNAEKYITDTIESIERQTYTNYEAIFIDDKSTDNSVEIIKKYAQKNKQMKIIELKRKVGVARARNIGIRKSKGRFLTFLDADDIWFDNKLESQLKFIKKNNYGFTYCSYMYMNDSGTKITKMTKIKEKTDYNYSLLNIRILPVTAMIDLYQIPKRYCYMPDVMIEDVVTWWKILKKGYIAYGQNEALVYYRRTKNSRSSKKYVNAYYRWKAYRDIEKLSIFKTIYCFLNYVINAILKRCVFMKKLGKFKELEVCVSTKNLKNDDEVKNLINKMRISTKYLIINQTKDEKVDINNKNVITKNEKGLSKSRNTVISNATSQIVLLSDDDVIYNKNYEKEILKAYNKYEDYDIICFYVKSRNKERKTKRMLSGNVGCIKTMRIISSEISFKRDSIINNGLMFNEQFGAGTKLNRGEENIFLCDALRKKLKIKFINKKIAEVEQESSTWFSKMDKEFLTIQGKVFKEMSPKYYKLLVLQFAIRKYHMYCKEISFFKCLKHMIYG